MDKKTLKENHNGSLGKLLKIYNTKGDLYKGTFLWTSIIVNLILIVFVYCLHINTYNLIVSVTDLYISILPSLLGFNLGAYALLIGLASSDLINKMSSSYETKFTSFQRASSVFGFCVLLQAVSLIISFSFKLITTINAGTDLIFSSTTSNTNLIHGINLISFFILNLFGIYSLLILISVIINIFALSQAAHFFAVTKHIKKAQEEEKKT